jgi:hypothetical protein
MEATSFSLVSVELMGGRNVAPFASRSKNPKQESGPEVWPFFLQYFVLSLVVEDFLTLDPIALSMVLPCPMIPS